MADRYASLKQGLVGCWIPSVSGSGLLLPDLSGRNNNGSLVGMDASDWVSASYGRALDFDGTDDYVGVANKIPATGEFTLSAFVKTSQASEGNIFSNNNSQAGRFDFKATSLSGGVYVPLLFINGSPSVVMYATTPVNDGKFHHVSVTRNAANLFAIYVDGRQENSTTNSVSIDTSTNYRIAARPADSTQNLTGQLDDVRLYSRALSESEIKLLASEPGIGFKRNSSAFATRYAYKPAKPRNYSVIRNRDPNYSTLRQGLVAAYCPSISGQGNVLPDLVGGNHGTLTNMTADDWVSSGDGRALDFDGTNDRVSTTETSSGTYLTQDFSHSIWINTTRTVSQTISQNRPPVGGSTNTKVWWILTGYSVSGEVSFNVFDLAFQFGADWDGLQTSGANIATGTWRHIAVTKKGATASIFIDGKLNISATGTAKEIDLGKAIHFALNFRDNNTPFLGLQDDVRIYNRALTEPEIKLLASKRGIGLEPRKPKITFADLGVQKTYSVVRVKETDYATLRQGLVGAWCPSLPNGGSGNTLPDQSGYGNHGTLTNMSPDDWVSSQYGRALDFDGTDDVVSLGVMPPAVRNLPLRDFSISFFCNPRSQGESNLGTIIDTYDTSAAGWYVLLRGVSGASYAIQSGVKFFSTDLTHISGNDFFAVNRFDHVAIVFRNATKDLLLYRNGLAINFPQTSTPSGTYNDDSSQAFRVGNRNAGDRTWDGQLDDIRIYNRALTEPEIKLLASKRGIGLQPSPTRFIARQKQTGLRRKILTGQT